MISLAELPENYSEIEQKVIEFIRNNVKKAGLDGAIVAVSGGIDSAVTLELTVKALGPDKVTAITMPECDITPERDITDVMQHCNRLNLTCNTVDITSMLRVIQENITDHDPADKIVAGNIRSRLRMIIAYHYANTQHKMVIGTSNKTELLIGFFTKYGDGGVDLIPLADLYKYQIKGLAKYLQIPVNIIEKPPSPGFYKGHTDETEIGLDYNSIDRILYATEKGLTQQQIHEYTNTPLSKIEMILSRVKANEHKRRLPLILRLS